MIDKIKCPYCKSEQVSSTGLAHAVGAGLDPRPKSKQYLCEHCNKLFNFPNLSKR